MRRLPDLGGAYLHPWRRETSRLSALPQHSSGRAGIHHRQRAQLTAITDLSLLRNEFTFGLNRIYLMFSALGFQTSCLVSVNDLVVEQCVG